MKLLTIVFLTTLSFFSFANERVSLTKFKISTDGDFIGRGEVSIALEEAYGSGEVINLTPILKVNRLEEYSFDNPLKINPYRLKTRQWRLVVTECEYEPSHQWPIWCETIFDAPFKYMGPMEYVIDDTRRGEFIHFTLK
ncbi:hypothetical protein HBN50_14815 [Halobacteriovorax sp. GB3]|uniref:hypothetical protein n=1 Tax=Halobacteriovorax sp. GB3 TaxID=2719615 RepID=UPI00235E42CB|nr:hypothetical protein [Halobacteriovorax sp. GB3]MDD0854382.1 hypothetical protein [Halobacteriovorax sp. GB3]